MVGVIKRDGKREDFDREKIVRACTGCGASRDLADRIATEVEEKTHEGMRTSEIKDIVLERLRAEDPRFVRNWMEYESTKSR